MLGDEKRLRGSDLFHTFNVDDLIPKNHLLRRLDAVLDLSWVRDEVADQYADSGRPSWDPEVIVRMILLGYLYDLSEVRLIDELKMHMGYRWFCLLQPSDKVPDRTTLVKLRNQKWKSEIWQKLLVKTIHQCQEAGLISGKHVTIDGTKIKANAAWTSLEKFQPVTSFDDYLENRYGWQVPPEDEPPSGDDDDDPTPKGGKNFRGKSLKNSDYRSSSDPDSRIFRKDDGEGAGLAYLGHFCIDTKSRVILGAMATLGKTSGEWFAGAQMLDFVKTVLGDFPRIITADRGYGVGPFYAETEKRGITPHIPPRDRRSRERRIQNSRLLGMQTVPFDRASRLIEKRRGIRGMNRACRLRNTRWFQISRRLRLRVEHKIGEAKCCHGLRRARHRGLGKTDVQVKITAAVMNLKALANNFRRSPKGNSLSFSSIRASLHRISSAIALFFFGFNHCQTKTRVLKHSEIGAFSQSF